MTSSVMRPAESTIYNLQSEIRRIAVFRALYLGDLLCATPALRLLRRRFPAAEITLIGLPWADELVRRLPSLDRLEVFPGYPGIAELPHDAGKTRAYVDAARAYGYDLAIQMHGDGSVSNGFVAELGARFSLGYRAGADGRLTASLPYESGEHEALRWLRLVDALQIAESRLQLTESAAQSAIEIDFPITDAERDRAAELLPTANGGPLIALHAGAKAAARRWPAARFAALADALAERYGASIVLTGGAQERQLTADVRRAMRHPALDLAGETDLGTFAAAIDRLDLLVTNDTGASHLAAATGTPSVVLFGPSRPEQWAPLDRERHRVVDALALAGPAADPSTALGRLPVEAVLEACEEMLAMTEDQRRKTKGWQPAIAGKALELGGSSLVLGPSSSARRG